MFPDLDLEHIPALQTLLSSCLGFTTVGCSELTPDYHDLRFRSTSRVILLYAQSS